MVKTKLAIDRLTHRCPSIRFYLRDYIDLEHDSPEAKAFCNEDAPWPAMQKWIDGAPRPVQRAQALAFNAQSENRILAGKVSGTGKTTAALEYIWSRTAAPDGRTLDHYVADKFLPLAVTGLEFARKVSEKAKANDLDEYLQSLVDPEILLFDDLDKKTNSEGKMSPTVQQALFDLIERRTTAGEDYTSVTWITMNSNGADFATRFDDDIGPYLIRRLRERFIAINFDPLIQPNVLQLEAAQ
jgi:hypothetical protein